MKGERGQILVITAMWLVLLLAFLGLVVDGGVMAAHYRKAQATLDMAAQAASHAVDPYVFWSTNRVRINTVWGIRRALAVVDASNRRGDGRPLVTDIRVHVTEHAVAVSGKAKLPTVFMRAVGIPEVEIEIRSVAYPAYGIEWEGQ